MKTAPVQAIVSVALLLAAVFYVSTNFDLQNILADLGRLSLFGIVVAILSLLANAMLAAVRFRMIASDTGFRISIPQAISAVSAGNLAGALFFQIAGQLAARGYVMRHASVPFAAVVVSTLYERALAALISAITAVFGALYVFGYIYLDPAAGGTNLIKVVAGVVAAALGAALLGYGRILVKTATPVLSRRFVGAFLRLSLLTLVVQAAMMLAYVSVAHQLSPDTSIVDLVAASAIVMFAASVPISLAGWGVRELSAVFALGAVGIAGSAALTTAVVIGVGSLLAMALMFALALMFDRREPVTVAIQTGHSFDYMILLGWCLPLVASVFVLFQIYVPLGSGLLNVNLADPVAMLGGALFIFIALQARHWPRWKAPLVNAGGMIATLCLGGSLLLGAYRFGWTDWALINRFAGWFVLLAFALTGAFATLSGGCEALKIVVLSYIGACVGVVVIELALIVLGVLEFKITDYLPNASAISGFAQNRNFFAFQLLIAVAGAIVFLRGATRSAVLGLLFAGLWFCGSRSGWITLGSVFAIAISIGVLKWRDGLAALCGAAAFVAMTMTVSTVLTMSGAESIFATNVVPTGVSTNERLLTLWKGWELFIQHPLFGAGLGAFRDLNILSSGRIPLVIHSTLLWLLAELGIVGCLAFAVPAVAALYRSWRGAKTDSGLALVLMCFVVMVVMSGPADMLYQRTFWLIVGAGIAQPLRYSTPAHQSTEFFAPARHRAGVAFEAEGNITNQCGATENGGHADGRCQPRGEG